MLRAVADRDIIGSLDSVVSELEKLELATVGKSDELLLKIETGDACDELDKLDELEELGVEELDEVGMKLDDDGGIKLELKVELELELEVNPVDDEEDEVEVGTDEDEVDEVEEAGLGIELEVVCGMEDVVCGTELLVTGKKSMDEVGVKNWDDMAWEFGVALDEGRATASGDEDNREDISSIGPNGGLDRKSVFVTD